MDNGRLDDEINWTAAFPLPFRVLVLAGLGILGWATNLHGLEAAGLDAISTMELRIDNEKRHPIIVGGVHFPTASPLYGPLYRMTLSYFSWISFTWLLYRYATEGDTLLVDVYGYIPGVSASIVLCVLVCPLNILFKQERDRFLLAIRRCTMSSMDSPVYFSDVVFADIFTSFAKVLGDVWLSLQMLLPGGSILQPPPQDGWTRWVVPMIMSLPYLIRFRQCIIEYTLPTNESRRPLYNALKYASSFPVIFLSAAQRLVEKDLQKFGTDVSEVAWHGEHPLFRLWLLSAAVNSLYSFWWDLTNDWGLTLLRQKKGDSHDQRPLLRRLVLPNLHSEALHSPISPFQTRHDRYDHSKRTDHPYGLRSMLLYPLPVYPLLIFLNLVLRLTWSIKLSSHLHSKRDGSITIFCLEVAEIVRRWMWVFLRVEWETIKRAEQNAIGQLGEAESGYELVQIPDV